MFFVINANDKSRWPQPDRWLLKNRLYTQNPESAHKPERMPCRALDRKQVGDKLNPLKPCLLMTKNFCWSTHFRFVKVRLRRNVPECVLSLREIGRR